jgi:nicotinate-nucleotide adenylyltransferase
MAVAAMRLGYNRIILIPAFQSPFKAREQGESAEVRLLMLLAAVSGDRRFAVDPCEVRRGGVSYTIDTLDDVRARYPMDGKPGLIVGDDLAGSFPEWKDAERILQAADIIVAGRLSGAKNAYPYHCVFLGNALVATSSASVRDMIRSGGDWKPHVPDGVSEIIEEHGLYGARKKGRESAGVRDSDTPAALPVLIKVVEDAARGMLNIDRFVHSRSVALCSADLAARYGLDPDMAYLAGVSHDMCKELSPEKMRVSALKDGGNETALEQEKPSLMHGRAAAVLLQERFGVTDGGILEAVRCHTTGKADMGPLARIVYVADKIEPMRTSVDPALRRLAFGTEDLSLDGLFDAVLVATVDWLRKRGMAVSDETRKLYSERKT